MKLIEVLSSIEIEDHLVQEAVDAVVDSVLVAELKEYRERRIEDYECVTYGTPRNVYVFGDMERDAFEISRRIEAIDLILSDYTVGHEPYDFDAEEWREYLEAKEELDMNKEVTMDRKLFDLPSLDLEKFKDIIRITGFTVRDTGLEMTGMRFDGGVIAFGKPADQEDYVSYNIDNDWLFVNNKVLTESQIKALKEIAYTFDLTIKEYEDGSN